MEFIPSVPNITQALNRGDQRSEYFVWPTHWGYQAEARLQKDERCL